MSIGSLLVSLGLENPTANADISHRVLASFLLGWVFFFSVQQLFLSPLLRTLIRKLVNSIFVRRAAAQTDNGLEANARPQDFSEKSRALGDDASSTFSAVGSERTSLTFTLTMCFALASLAQVISLTTFNPSKGDVACAFIIAWAGMSFQSGRIIGLLRLSFDLVSFGVRRWESFTLWGGLVVALIFMFITNAVSIGTLRGLSIMPGVSLCYRKHFLPTAVVMSLINLILEIYCLVRIFSFVGPSFLTSRDRLAALGDIRVLRALSLIVLDLLTVVPSTQFFSILSDFIPFSIGALVVVAAFNYYPRGPSAVSPTISSRISIRAPSRGSVVMIGRFPSRGATPPAPPPKPIPIVSPQPPRIPHPFAMEALRDETPERDYPAPMTARSVGPASPMSDTASINGAVVKLAFREPMRGRSRSSFPPPITPSFDAARDSSLYSRPTPSAFAQRIPSSIIEFASPRTSSAPSAPGGGARHHRPRSDPPFMPLVVPTVTVASTSVRQSVDTTKSLADVPVSPSELSPGSSVLYGSDVVRASRPPLERQSSSTATIGHLTTHRDSRRLSTGSARNKDELSVVYEASFEASTSEPSNPSAQQQRQTFGEGAFRTSMLPGDFSAPHAPSDVSHGSSTNSTGERTDASRRQTMSDQ